MGPTGAVGLTRRAALAGTAAILIGGCRGPRHRAVAAITSTPTSSAATKSSVGFGWSDATALRAFAAFDPSVTLIPEQAWAAQADGTRPAAPWAIGPRLPYGPNDEGISLGPAIRNANLDLSVLIPGAEAAFTVDGAICGLPIWSTVLGVRYRQDLFTRAGLQPPAPHWTIEDFEGVCEVLQAAIAAGRLPDTVSPLPALVGTSGSFTGPSPSGVRTTGTVTGNLQLGTYGDVWAAFVLGYGGWTARGGLFDLTNPGALEGLQVAVHLAKTYGAAQRYLPTTAQQAQAYSNRFVMQFDMAYLDATGAIFAYPQTPPTAMWRWARFPRLPASPVVLLTPIGVGLQPASPAVVRSYPASEAALAAAVQFARWQYGLVEADPTAANLLPPVLSTPGLQARYWASDARRTSGIGPLGQDAVFALARDGWPSGSAGARPGQAVLAALSEVVLQGEDLKQAMAVVQEGLNAPAPAGTG